ncbi:DUF3843 family protein [Bacteroides sp.]
MGTLKIYRQSWMKSRAVGPLHKTDMWYVDFANSLLLTLEKMEFYHTLMDRERLELPLYLTWYLEDCVNNSGCWNRFIGLHHKYYGRYLPFYDLPEDYLADEVNLEDVYYILWTIGSALGNDNIEPGDPFAPWIMEAGPVIYKLIDEAFEQAPITDVDTLDWLNDMEAMWYEPKEVPAVKPGEKYKPDVENFLAASGGESLMFFDTYRELRPFLLGKLHWAEDEPIMDSLRREKEFVLYANPKGLMVTPYLSAFFCDPRNPYYDAERARKEGSEMFYVPSYTPIDLVKYGETNNLFPEAAFSFPDGKRILHENWDFIARRYLTLFYDAD